MICNSLGSNFLTLAQASEPLFISNQLHYRTDLDAYLQRQYQGEVIMLYKGRESLALALQLASLPAGSYVAINGFTCFAVYKAIAEQGLHIEYLDIETNSLDFSADTFRKAIQRNPKIKAVIVQNSLGYPADVLQIKAICEQQGVILIEDLAHSIGTTYQDGQLAGTVGDFTVLSFSQDKIIDSVSGGALIVRNQLYCSRLSKVRTSPVPPIIQLRDRLYPLFTWIIRNTHSLKMGAVVHRILKSLHLLARPMNDLGSGFHELPNWQCRLALQQLQSLDTLLHHRRKIAKIYSENLSKNLLLQAISTTIAKSSALRFPLLVSNRQTVLKYLKDHNYYLSDVWYDSPLGPSNYLKYSTYTNQCPHSEMVTKKIINLPTHRNITEKQAKQLVALINSCQK